MATDSINKAINEGIYFELLTHKEYLYLNHLYYIIPYYFYTWFILFILNVLLSVVYVISLSLVE